MKRLIESELLKMQTIWARWGTKWLKYLWILIWRVAHFPSHSFRGSVCKCSHCTVIFLWNLVLLCPHTSPDPQLAVDMGLTSMQKLLRKLQGARLYGSRDARLNFLLSQVGSPGEAKCVLFMPRLLASAYRTHNLLWCVELYAEIDPASFANSGGWWFHTQLSV